jgi:hypothetical protein
VEIKVEFSEPDWDELQREIERDIASNVSRKIEGIRCPVHNEAPKVTYSKAGDEMKWEVEGCCEQVVALVEKTLD